MIRANESQFPLMHQASTCISAADKQIFALFSHFSQFPFLVFSCSEVPCPETERWKGRGRWTKRELKLLGTFLGAVGGLSAITATRRQVNRTSKLSKTGGRVESLNGSMFVANRARS